MRRCFGAGPAARGTSDRTVAPPGDLDRCASPIRGGCRRSAGCRGAAGRQPDDAARGDRDPRRGGAARVRPKSGTYVIARAGRGMVKSRCRPPPPESLTTREGSSKMVPHRVRRGARVMQRHRALRPAPMTEWGVVEAAPRRRRGRVAPARRGGPPGALPPRRRWRGPAAGEVATSILDRLRRRRSAASRRLSGGSESRRHAPRAGDRRGPWRGGREARLARRIAFSERLPRYARRHATAHLHAEQGEVCAPTVLLLATRIGAAVVSPSALTSGLEGGRRGSSTITGGCSGTPELQRGTR